MDAARWQRLSPLLDALFELESDARERRLDELRDEDDALAAELEELIALEDEREDFLAQPLVAPVGGVQAGSEVGPYRLESLLGEGGMGQVWLAARADGLYQRRVALKLLRPGLADTNLRLRFTRERQILARLAHPNIARLLDAGLSSDNLPYLALEYVDGQPITDYCREHATPLDQRLRMFGQVCEAVSHAHANLIVHRDLKPSNILVTPAGDVRLLDFGIAKLLDTEVPAPERTGTGVRAFTLHYAAPEQIRGEPVSTMTDVYSLGVVLYELLTNRKPYRLKRNSDAEWEEAILSADPLRPSQAVLRETEQTAPTTPAARRQARALNGDLDNVVLKTLSKRAEQRYPSVEALSLDLQRYEAGRPVQARAQSLGYRTRKYLRRHRWAVATGCLVALVLVSALGSVAWQARQAVQEASRAQAMQEFMVGLFDHASTARDGTPLDLRQLLDDAVERGNRELARQPRARAELLGVIARVRVGLGDYREALELLQRQGGIIAVTEGLPDSLRMEAVTQRGRVLRLLDRHQACIALLQPVLPLSRREQAQLPGQASELYSQLGRCRRVAGEHDSARRLFEHSLALRRELGGDSVGEVENLMDLAGLHADVGELQTALRGFDRARAQLRGEVGDRHPLLVEIRRNLGTLHHALGDLDAAERQLRAALDLSLELHGTQRPTSLAVRRELAAVHAEQGRFADADRGLREVHRLLVDRLGADHPDLTGSYANLGMVTWERNDHAEAIELLQHAVALSRAHGDRADVAFALFDLARVLHDDGRHDDARALLGEARTLSSEHYGPRHARVGDVDRLLGEVEIALDDRASGEARLHEAVRLTRAGHGAGHPNTRRSELALAYRTGLAGHDGTREQLDTLAALDEDDHALRRIAWRARAYAAHVRCHGREHERALESLQALSDQLSRRLPGGGVIPREVAAIRSACEAAPGDRALATR